jgi:RimJ/RimL family protein N-acetyltransferase
MDEFQPLCTERLILRRFGESDVEPFMAYRFDPEVARFQTWDACTRQQALGFIREQQSVQPGIPGIWFQYAIALKNSGALIGDCGLFTHHDDRQQADIGYTLAREFQGQGYATEAVSRILDFAFGELTMHRIVAMVDCENRASVALLERLGMRREAHFIQNFWFKGRWGDEYWYAMLGDEWLGKKRTG